MSIDRNRKFRFSFSNIEASIIDPDKGTGDAKEIKLVASNTKQKKDSFNVNDLDPKTRNKLQLMAQRAKNNPDESQEQMEEYFKKVPAHQDNQIAMSIAKDKLKELREKMEKEIKSTSENTATNEILESAANDNIIYRQYKVDDLDKYIEKISEMTLLECISLKNSVSKELNRLESCNEMITTVNKFRENFDVVPDDKEITALDRKNVGTNINKQIMIANYLDEYGFKESQTEFDELYKDCQPKLTTLVEKLNERINDCKKDANSTKYMTNEFIKIMDKKINSLQPTDVNYQMTLKNLTLLKDAFDNRIDFKYLHKKVYNFYTNKNKIRDLAKALKGTFSNIGSKINKGFSKRTLHTFINYLYTYFGKRDGATDENIRNTILVLFYILNEICTNEERSGENVWVKILFLNINDIAIHAWDLDITSDEYMDRVGDALMDLCYNIYYENEKKIKINPQIIGYFDFLRSEKALIEPEDKDKKSEELLNPEVDNSEES